jgi:hypothetical protein
LVVLEEADPVLVGEDIWLVAGILAFQQAKEWMQARLVNQGVAVKVETLILDVVVCRIAVYDR